MFVIVLVYRGGKMGYLTDCDNLKNSTLAVAEAKRFPTYYAVDTAICEIHADPMSRLLMGVEYADYRFVEEN